LRPNNLRPNCRDFGDARQVLVRGTGPGQRKTAVFLPIRSRGALPRGITIVELAPEKGRAVDANYVEFVPHWFS
jgi:hypothetical protein